MAFSIGLSTVSTPVTCNGVTSTITTTQNSGESTEDFVDRHWDAVRAAENACS